MIIYLGKMRGPQVAIICMDKLETTDIKIYPQGQDRLQRQKLWCVNGCFCRLGEAGQLFSGDSEKQWTTAVLTANVRFLLLMLAARHYEEDLMRNWSRL